ncbi:MAG TPA: Na+/H+ antiporter NhaA [Gammaproteobacteria bacterium]|nr:Na+/H+ antiporter NhaA [Gammaproteobacteria bacterium]
MALRVIRAFLKMEAGGGIILCLMAVLAIFLANSPFASYYEAVQASSVKLLFGKWELQFPFLSGVNEGLMTFFFLLIGLELKREFFIGHLRDARHILLPGVAALGGMVVPALIYALINHANPVGLKGWAIPVATDIAFALAIVSLLGKKVPNGLKLFLMTLAIFDDVGAIIIIAFFNIQTLSGFFLWWAFLLLMGLGLLNRLGVLLLLPYLVLGFLLWFCFLKAGIHPTIAGVLLAFFIPLTQKNSPLQRLEHELHEIVAYCVMPLFAFMNAGLSFHGILSSVYFDTITLGIVAGLFLGKQIGVFGFSYAMVKLRFASLPDHASWLQLYGVALLCGIGFTMSLFLGTLVFENEFPVYLTHVRLGVLIASLLSGIVGAIMLQVAFRIKTSRGQ